MSAVSSVQARIVLAGLSQEQVARLLGLRPNDVGSWLRGHAPMPTEVFHRVHELIADIERLQQIASPFPLDPRNTNRLKNLLRSMRDGDFDWLTDAKEAHQRSIASAPVSA